MFLKKLDYLSPRISLYYSGTTAHTSKISGILSIANYSIVMIVLIYYLIVIFCKTEKIAFYYIQYSEDPGVTKIDDSSLFHYLSINGNVGYDPKAIKIIGLKGRPSETLKNLSESSFDHWKYSECNFETDVGKDIRIKINNTRGPLCIKEFYNYTTGEIVKPDNKNFVYPSLLHGSGNPGFVPYLISIQRCQNSSYFNECYTDEEIDEYINELESVNINLVDYYIDIDNYNFPFYGYLYTMEVGFLKSGILAVNFHFNPTDVQTHEGFIFDSTKRIRKMSLSDSIRGTYEGQKSTSIGIMTFWVHNQVRVYDRKYTKIVDVIANISGIAKLVGIIFYFVNLGYNKYIMYQDFFNVMKVNASRKKNEYEKTISKGNLVQIKSKLSKAFTKKEVSFYSFFQKSHLSFLKIIQHYSRCESDEYMQKISKIRKTIISEERMVKLYLLTKALKKSLAVDKNFCENQTIITTLVEGDFRNLVSLKNNFLERNKKDLNSSNNGLMIPDGKGFKKTIRSNYE